jgi:hypothetical protein
MVVWLLIGVLITGHPAKPAEVGIGGLYGTKAECLAEAKQIKVPLNAGVGCIPMLLKDA